MPPILTFCIPTFNRAEYLSETLNCIINQASDDIEIVISDNCSDDETEKVVMDAQKIFKNIVYYKWESNQGADRNYLKSVELASGKFCWFMGSDDLIAPESLNIVRKYLTDDVDVALCSQYICDINMKPMAIHYLQEDSVPSKLFLMNDKEQLIEYFNGAQSHSAMFGFLSTIIFRRDIWTNIEYDNSYTGTLYSHMFMLYSFLNNRLNLQYIKNPLVYWRGGNDSFGGKGRIQERFMVDFVGFNKIMSDFFSSDEDVLHAFRGAFRRHHPFKNIAYLRLNVKSESDWRAITKIAVEDFDYNSSIFVILKSSAIKPVLFLLFKLNKISKYIKAIVGTQLNPNIKINK